MNKVTEFTNEHNVEMEFHLYTVKELRNESDNQKSNWDTFEFNAGLVCIFNDITDKLESTSISIDSKNIGKSAYKLIYGKKGEQLIKNENDIILSIIIKEKPYMSAILKKHLNNTKFK